MTSMRVSACCGRAIIFGRVAGTTQWYVCESCRQPCDTIVKPSTGRDGIRRKPQPRRSEKGTA